MIRVLFVTHYSTNYGANKSLLCLIKDLKERYNISPFVILPGEGPMVDALKSNNIDYSVEKIYMWRKQKKEYKDIGRILLNYINARRLAKKYIGKFDIIHTNSSVTNFGQLLADCLNIPHIWHLREYGFEDYNIDFIIPRALIYNTIKRASEVICISESIRNYYISKVCKDGKYRVIYNGVTLGQNIQKKCKKDSCTNFCCVGLIVEGKRQIDIIEACRILIKNNIGSFVVHFIGEGDEEYIAYLKRKVTEYRLEPYIKFWGHRNDVASILEDMDVGIVSSTKEAFGRVTIEYMLSGLPVIGSDSGGTPELLIDGDVGYLFKTGDAKDLANKMTQYMNNIPSIRLHGEKAKRYASDNFNVRNNTDSIYKLYSNVVKGFSYDR